MNLAGFTRNAHLWLPGYLSSRMGRDGRPPKRVWLTIADHYEPLWHGADEVTARARVETWRRQWPEIASRHHDSIGRPPCYTFFYPEEEYRPQLLDPLAGMAETGIADVEVHIHHDGEGQQNFVDRISRFTEALHGRHGLLRKEDGKIRFGFIHGNWALDNSRPDGRWCGLNNEITLLAELGCYADFTLPSVPSPTQTRIVNTIYWATDDPERPKSHDHGVPVTRRAPGQPGNGRLLMIPGPLALNWRGRRRALVPRIETGELAAYHRPDAQRVRLWIEHAPRIADNAFIKLFAHGTQERNSEAMLSGDLDSLFGHVADVCARQGVEFRYASAWETYEAIAGLCGWAKEAVAESREVRVPTPNAPS